MSSGHINPLSSFQPYLPFGRGFRMFWGRVIDNEDERLLHRIKVQVQDLIPFETTEELPWCYPLFPNVLGQGPLTGSQSVPEIDSYVMIIYPEATIYMGYYMSLLSDRLRRLPDLLSEYPERYGHIDSIENKDITNKAPRLNTKEYRRSDGTLTVEDSRDHNVYHTDEFGTNIFIDRKNQLLRVKFGGVILRIHKGTLKIGLDKFTLDAKRLINITSKDYLGLIGKNIVSVLGRVFSNMSKIMHTSDELSHEVASKHKKRGDTTLIKPE